MNIVLIGYKGVGKTTVGITLARQLSLNFIDLDQKIEELDGTGLTAKEVYAKKGEEYFRDLEYRICSSLAGVEKSVIATGGGTVLSPKSMQILGNLGVVIYLKSSPENLFPRLENQVFLGKNHTLKTFREEFLRREALYLRYADKVVEGGFSELVNFAVES